MKTAFALLLVALMILPAIAVVRIRLNRVRREIQAQAQEGVTGNDGG